MVWSSWGKSWGGGSGTGNTYLLVNSVGSDISEIELSTVIDTGTLEASFDDYLLSSTVSGLPLVGMVLEEDMIADIQEITLSCEVVE